MLIKQRRARLALITLLLTGVLIAGCSRGFVPYQPTAIPADVTKLFRVFGDIDSDTVWIFAQGGPFHMLEDGAYELFTNYPDHRDLEFVQVHQTLTLNHDLAERDAVWMLAELQAEVDVSVEILHRTIEHFKAQDKHVVVVGHSYGAFLVTRYLALKGPEAADQYLLMAGRLDMPEVVVEGFRSGTAFYFPNYTEPEVSRTGSSTVSQRRIANSWRCASRERPDAIATRPCSPTRIWSGSSTYTAPMTWRSGG